MQAQHARTRLRFAGLTLGVLGLFALDQVSLEPARPEAIAGSVPLLVDATTGATDPIRLDATAVGLSWDGESGFTAAWVRASEDGRAWGRWTEVHDPDDHGPDGGTGESGANRHVSEAVYVGPASHLQFRVEGAPPGLAVEYVDTTGRGTPLWDRLIDMLGRVRLGGGEPALADVAQPAIVPRSAWGGDQCIAANPDYELSYVRRVEVLFVHHTIHSASSNAYSPDDVDDLLYAICAFHVTGQGWEDIAYNFLIDRFGRTWEGRAGGIDRPVRGAHTGGFNSYSTGVAFLGDHRSLPPTPEAIEAFVTLASWKLDVHHVDPLSAVTVESLGSTRFPEGAPVSLRAISGHRDVSTTSCPGDTVLALIDALRARIAADPTPRIYGGWPDQEPIPGFQATAYGPAAFRFRMTEEMTWTLTVRDGLGAELLRANGTGVEGVVPWDGRVNGSNLPFGDYLVRVEAVPTGGAAMPRPAEFTFQLGSYLPPFSDDERSVHEPDIGTIFERGITRGCAPELFCPLATVSRWEMALFLTRLHSVGRLALPDGGPQGFSDVSSFPLETQVAINQLAQLGITTGTGPGTFDPIGAVTRWQMALFLTRQLGAAGTELPDGSDRGFADLAGLPDDTQRAINQLAQLGITSGTGPGTFDPGAAVTRQQMASFLARTLATLGVSSPNPA